jgi:hypothetical protein
MAASLPGKCALVLVLHILEDRAILHDEGDIQPRRRLEGAEENLAVSDRFLQVAHPKRHVRQIAHGALHRAVRLVAEVLDMVRVIIRARDPHLRFGNEYLSRLLLVCRQADMLKLHSHWGAPLWGDMTRDAW